MTRILACTDGSVYAESIIDHAAWAARQLGGAGVRVLHVLDREGQTVPTDRSGTLGFDSSEALLRELSELDATRNRIELQRSRAMLAAAEARLRAAGVEHVTLTQRHGALVDTVVEFEAEADLLVVGKRGEAADFAVGHLGANLERVLRASPKPVLVASRRFTPIRRFAIAFDGSQAAIRMVEFAALSPAVEGLETDLVAVVPLGDAGAPLLDTPASILARAGRKPRTATLHGEVDEAIATYVAAEGIDLLVMGAYGHGRLRTMVLGSTTTALLRACRIPVLVFR